MCAGCGSSPSKLAFLHSIVSSTFFHLVQWSGPLPKRASPPLHLHFPAGPRTSPAHLLPSPSNTAPPCFVSPAAPPCFVSPADCLLRFSIHNLGRNVSSYVDGGQERRVCREGGYHVVNEYIGFVVLGTSNMCRPQWQTVQIPRLLLH